MLRAVPVHAESARYQVPLLFVGGLWSAPEVWRGVASYLAHRGWAGQLLAFDGIAGGLAARTDALASHLRRQPTPAAIVAHDAGAVVASLAAAVAPSTALVLVAPLEPGAPAMRLLTQRWDALVALALGRRVPPPTGTAAQRCFGPIPAAIASLLVSESRDAVLDVVRGRVRLERPGVPTLLTAGADDPLLPSADRLASALGAEYQALPARGHWPLAGPGWQTTVATVHRWLVHQVGEDALDLYDEAMAERDAGDGEPEQ